MNYQMEDGMSIEPEWYMPVVPIVLLNGADGIGTGKFRYSASFDMLLKRHLRLEYEHPEL